MSGQGDARRGCLYFLIGLGMLVVGVGLILWNRSIGNDTFSGWRGLWGMIIAAFGLPALWDGLSGALGGS